MMESEQLIECSGCKESQTVDKFISNGPTKIKTKECLTCREIDNLRCQNYYDNNVEKILLKKREKYREENAPIEKFRIKDIKLTDTTGYFRIRCQIYKKLIVKKLSYNENNKLEVYQQMKVLRTKIQDKFLLQL